MYYPIKHNIKKLRFKLKKNKDERNTSKMAEKDSTTGKDCCKDIFRDSVELQQAYFEKYGVTLEVVLKWKGEQEKIKEQIITNDTEEWQYSKCLNNESEGASSGSELKYIAGADLAYLKEDDRTSCVAVVICEVPSLNVVHKYTNIVTVSEPYVPGFLAFREAEIVTNAINHVLNEVPEYKPQIVMLDGNGILHPRGCGLACHVGVALDLPCVGVAKNLYHVDGIERNDAHKKAVEGLNVGDFIELKGNSGRVLGTAVRTTASNVKPVYISVGHRCSIDTAVWLVNLCAKFRIPEPTRQADILCNERMRLYSN